MGEDRALVRLGAAPRRLRDRLGAAGAALDGTHIGALQALADFYRKQKRWAELVEALARHAECETERPARVEILLALADPTRRSWATRRRRWPRTSARWTPTSIASTRSTRSSGCTGGRRRGTAWSTSWPRSRRWSATPSRRSGCKLQVGELWEERLGDNDRAVDAYKEVLSVDPHNLPALSALERLYEKTGHMEEYLEILEHQLEVSPPEDERVAPYQRMATVWEEHFGKPDRAAEALEKILLIDERNAKAYRDLERLYRQERKWEALVDTYRKHIRVTADATERIELYTAMGQVYEEELRDLDRAIEAYNDVLSSRTITPRARGPRAPLRGDRAVGPRDRHDAAADSRQHRPAPEGRPQLPPGQDLRRAAEGAGARRGVPGRGAVAGSRPRAVDGGAARALQAARRLAQGGAADGARRGGDRQPAGEDAPAVRGRQDLPGEAGRRGAGQRAVRARARSSTPSTSRRASRWRSSTSSARSGRRWCRSSTCWPARPIARPTAS